MTWRERLDIGQKERRNKWCSVLSHPRRKRFMDHIYIYILYSYIYVYIYVFKYIYILCVLFFFSRIWMDSVLFRILYTGQALGCPARKYTVPFIVIVIIVFSLCRHVFTQCLAPAIPKSQLHYKQKHSSLSSNHTDKSSIS